MKHPEPTDTHTHAHAEGCACTHDHGHDHSHDHGQSHDHPQIPLGKRWLISVLIVGILLFCLHSFIIAQMLVRVTSYAANSSYSDAIRMCQKIIVLDHSNIQAWTSLGYTYMDTSQVDRAIAAFEHVLRINPQDRGAASFELGRAYYLKGDYAKAIDCFERVRNAGPRASSLLEADVLKYRHGTLGFRNLNSMQTLLGLLVECYKHTGEPVKAAAVQKEYDYYKNRQSKILF